MLGSQFAGLQIPFFVFDGVPGANNPTGITSTPAASALALALAPAHDFLYATFCAAGTGATSVLAAPASALALPHIALHAGLGWQFWAESAVLRHQPRKTRVERTKTFFMCKKLWVGPDPPGWQDDFLCFSKSPLQRWDGRSGETVLQPLGSC